MVMVTVIVPNWNGKKFLSICLRSVLASTFRNYEVIVVDNGSTDGSLEEALIYAQQHTRVVRVISLGKNYGFPRACNEGIRQGRGEYIVLLNNDVEVEPTWLGELVAGMVRHPECGMGTSKMVQYDNRKQIYNTGDVFKVWCQGGGRGFCEVDTGKYEKEEYVFGACAGAGIYRKSLFEKIGLFDEQFFIFSEDVDINLRAQLVGERCMYFPKAIVYHWGTATVGFNSDRHVFLFVRNNLFVLVKNYRVRELWAHMGRIMRELLNDAVTYSLSGQGWVVCKSRLSFLWFLPGMLIKRVALLRTRMKSLDEIEEIIR